MRVVSAIEKVLPRRRPIHHHEPFIDGKEIACLHQCIQLGITGNYWNKQLQSSLEERCAVKHVILVSSGTAALHVALLAAGIKPNDEVLVPTLTFAGTAHAISYCGAVPNFIDSRLCVSTHKLRRHLEQTKPNPEGSGRLNFKTGRVISALIVVDLLGFPADYTGGLCDLADEFGLTLIEDAAQAFGSSLGNRQCGSFGRAATFSFNNNKIVTGNGGGAILTNDDELATKAHQLSTTGRVDHPWKVEHNVLGYNYRMGNLTAALVCAQLGQLDKFLGAKKALLARYEGAGLRPLKATEPWQGNPNYWLTTILVENRDELLEDLHAKGIFARALSTPLHQLPYYKDCPRDDLSQAEFAFSRAVCLPSGVDL